VKSGVLNEKALFTRQFKGKCQNCGQKSLHCKNHSKHNGGNNRKGTGANFCLFYHKRGHDKKSCFKLKKMEAQNGYDSNFKGNAEQRNHKSQDVVFTATSKNKILTDDIWICDSGACGHYCKSDKGLFDVKDNGEKITTCANNKECPRYWYTNTSVSPSLLTYL
jgi:hypothetical protein